MAGKSTFLRTVALHIVMANVGLPVCAKESKYKPIKLVTSMRTTDSLTDDSSYFFSELTRLKFIVDTLKNGESYFVILDEILFIFSIYRLRNNPSFYFRIVFAG